MTEVTNIMQTMFIPGLLGGVSLAAFLRDPEQKTFNIFLAILWAFAVFYLWPHSKIVSLGCVVMFLVYAYLLIPKSKALKEDDVP